MMGPCADTRKYAMLSDGPRKPSVVSIPVSKKPRNPLESAGKVGGRK